MQPLPLVQPPRRRPLIPLLLALAFTAVAALPAARAAAPPNEGEAKAQVTKVLEDQVHAWNLGDIDKFMDGYVKSDTLRFATGANVTYGWRQTLERYKLRYPSRAAMGTLAFSDVAIDVLGPDAAVAFGRWRTKTDVAEPHGLFTLIFRRTETGWKIVADHTSAATN